jgi:hypothetical protein
MSLLRDQHVIARTASKAWRDEATPIEPAHKPPRHVFDPHCIAAMHLAITVGPCYRYGNQTKEEAHDPSSLDRRA